jgi:short-subunit dehydrogenase
MQKIALITGATAGIGRAFAQLLAARGHSLALVARDEPRLIALSGELERTHNIRALVLARDLSDPDVPAEIFATLQRENVFVSTLINNAGAGIFGSLAETELSRQLALLQLNMGAVVQLTKLFMHPMVDKREGRILNVASTTSFQPGPHLALYSASKAFLLSFSCALAIELENTGVTVTTLCPGATATEFLQRAGMKLPNAIRPMSAESVAEIGYKAMMAGRPLVVAGWKNKVLAAVSRRVPLMWAARGAGRFNHNR